MTLPQADAAGAVAGHADLVLVVGPAGTGKTTALRPAVEHLRATGRAVFGVAPSATGAEVLSEETGVAADTIHKLLIEHTLNRPPDHRYDLPVGATVIVDEAGMLPTEKLAEMAHLADTRGWRLALVGDPLQFSAVGRGGMFALMVDTFGAIELDEVHRFANEWEREASLRLRRGDVSVAEVYDAHDRLHAGTIPEMERAAARLWHELRQAGKRELLMTPTNEATERLNERCQRLRIRAGEIDADGRSVDVGAYRLYVGDEIATRQNERRLLTDRDDMVRNRAVWTIDAIHRDGSLTATGKSGVVHLPADTSTNTSSSPTPRTGMGGQGRNVLGGLLFADRLADIRNLYVAMTRGSEMNHAFFGVTGEETAVDVFVQCMTTDWIDQPATVRHAELNQTTPHRPGLLDGPVLRSMMEQRHEILTSLDDAESIVDSFHPHRHVLEAEITEARKTRARAAAEYRAAENVIETHDRPLRRRKHEHEMHLGRRYNVDSVRGFDVTASAPKSVSVLFALGDDDIRREVLDAHDAAVTALAGWIERHAHTRYRIGGEVAVVDAEGIVAAMFRQHTSRALDPQLHTHLVIANRVKSPDGRWLALDARLIKGDQRTLSALYHAGLRSELTQRLGVAWHTPENGIAEIRDVPEALLAEFSLRTAQMRRRVEEKLDRFVDTMGREPTPQERWLIDREAAVDSRPRKAKSVDAASLHDGWRCRPEPSAWNRVR